MTSDTPPKKNGSLRRYLLALPFILIGLWIATIGTLFIHAQSRNPNPLLLYGLSKVLGGHMVAAELTATDGSWDNVLQGIRSAERRWLMLANELTASRGSHTMEELYGALSVALDKSPQSVLSLDKVDPATVCAITDHDHDNTKVTDFRALHAQRKKAISSLRVPDLQKRIMECQKATDGLLAIAS